MKTHIQVTRKDAEVLVGMYEQSLRVTEQKIAELQHSLNGSPRSPRSPRSPSPSDSPRKRRKLNAAARKSIALAQRKRWAAYRKAKSAKSAK